jgi:hypothetical protein
MATLSALFIHAATQAAGFGVSLNSLDKFGTFHGSQMEMMRCVPYQAASLQRTRERPTPDHSGR